MMKEEDPGQEIEICHIKGHQGVTIEVKEMNKEWINTNLGGEIETEIEKGIGIETDMVKGVVMEIEIDIDQIVGIDQGKEILEEIGIETEIEIGTEIGIGIETEDIGNRDLVAGQRIEQMEQVEPIRMRFLQACKWLEWVVKREEP